ncbi:MAG: hypothetical protein Q7U82_01530 [Gammaproteobacteria bacterium]|nr:hypothetical protein [Gammaproteobacteria bacterium]
MRKIVTVLMLFSAASSLAQDAPQQQLLELVEAGRTCEPVQNNGMLCTFKVDNQLTITIKDVGGSDTVVGFDHSDISERFYAVLYFGCVVVVPGNAHERNYDLSYGAFISPKNAAVYSTREECQSAD